MYEDENTTGRVLVGMYEDENTTGRVLVGMYEDENTTGRVLVGMYEDENTTGRVLVGMYEDENTTGRTQVQFQLPFGKYCFAIHCSCSLLSRLVTRASFIQQAFGSVLTQYSPTVQLLSCSEDDCCLVSCNLEFGTSRPCLSPSPRATLSQAPTPPITSATFSTVRVGSEGETQAEGEDSEENSELTTLCSFQSIS